MQDPDASKPDHDPYINQTVQVKLPDGLYCDHCVLQWEWIAISPNCLLPDGSRTLGDKCVSQTYKNCVDIKIKFKLMSPAYKPNPVSNIYQKYNGPPVFQWYNMDMLKDKKGNIVRLNQPDPLVSIVSNKDIATLIGHYSTRTSKACSNSISIRI